jgi:hypothetical protein
MLEALIPENSHTIPSQQLRISLLSIAKQIRYKKKPPVLGSLMLAGSPNALIPATDSVISHQQGRGKEANLSTSYSARCLLISVRAVEIRRDPFQVYES